MSQLPYLDAGARLRAARQFCDLTQETIAENLGMRRSAISQMERGRSMVSLDVANWLESTHGISLRWLLSGRGPMRLEEVGKVAETEAGYDVSACQRASDTVIIQALYGRLKRLRAEAERAKRRSEPDGAGPAA